MRRAAIVLCGMALAPWAHAALPEASAWFDEGLRYELGEGVAADAQRALRLYRQAADAGLPEAAINVAIMLDSGRGTEPDIAQAAVWYARAAARGNIRAAFNLGQLYEAGQGVPRNADLARAWFNAAASLPAARARQAAIRPDPAPGRAPLSAPRPLWPSAGAHLVPGTGGFELVWTSLAQPEPAQFFVELRALDGAESRDVFAGFSGTSSLFVAVPDAPGDYAWRVMAVARDAGRYLPAGWVRFSIAPAP